MGPREPRPWDPTWVGQALRKRSTTAIHRNYDFGKDCGITAVWFYYNKIHGFWDGSVYVPEGQTLPDTNAIVRDIQRRQLTLNGELVRRPAKERKQAKKLLPCKVQKQRTERNLRHRKAPSAAYRTSHASPALTQITVGGSQSVRGNAGASIWSVPCSPESTWAGPPNLSNGNERNEEISPPADLVIPASNHCQVARHRRRRQQQTSSTSTPTTTEQDAEGEPCGEASDGGTTPLHTQDGADKSPDELPASHDFTAMMPDNAWMMEMDMDMDMDMDRADLPDMPDLDMDYFGSLDLDVDMNINMNMSMPNNVSEPQASPGNHSPKAPTVSMSVTKTVAFPADPDKTAGKNWQTSKVPAIDESAPRPAPEPDFAATVNPNTDKPGLSQTAPNSAQARRAFRQPRTCTETNTAPGQSRSSNPPPITTTRGPHRCTPEEVMTAMQQALLNLIAQGDWSSDPNPGFGGIQEAHPRLSMSIPAIA